MLFSLRTCAHRREWHLVANAESGGRAVATGKFFEFCDSWQPSSGGCCVYVLFISLVFGTDCHRRSIFLNSYLDWECSVALATYFWYSYREFCGFCFIQSNMLHKFWRTTKYIATQQFDPHIQPVKFDIVTYAHTYIHSVEMDVCFPPPLSTRPLN